MMQTNDNGEIGMVDHRLTSVPEGIPVYDIDYYSDEVIRDPYPHYAAMRALGPVVYIPQLGNYAVSRYAEVREVLQDWKSFSSEDAIPADQAGCDYFKGGSNLVTDPPVHDAIRVKMAAPLLPGALVAVREQIEDTATALIERLVKRQNFDGMIDLARHLPETLVTELVGLPEDGRDNMLLWAASAFDITGIQNERGRQGVEVLNEMRHWIVTKATPDRLKPGSLTARIRDMVAAGEIPEELFLGIMNDYITPSLDTTISATGELLYQLGRNPDQWALLQQNPSLIDNAVNEAVRVGSPIRSFTRRATRACTLAGVDLPENARIMVIYASANRDERKFPDPDRFDVTRTARDHVGFGHGIHMCVGMHLAKLEMASILKAMIQQVDRIEVGEPTMVLNNTIHAFATLPVRFTAREQLLTIEVPSHDVSPANESWIHAKVVARTQQADDIVSIELANIDGRPLPAFEAGSHIDVEVADGIVRQYSLSTDPAAPGAYRIGVLREAASRGGSAAVHDRLEIGAPLRISRPRNFFPLNEAAPESILMAGGIGVTPIMAMAYRLHSIGAPFALHYANRTKTRAAFLDELRNSAFGDHVAAYFDDGPVSSRLNVETILTAADPGAHLYCCGPKGFIDHVVNAAQALGWPANQIHVEHFAATPVLTGAPFDVIAARSGRTFHIPCEKTILEVLNEAGIDIPSSCHSGVCATCMTSVIDGVPDHRDMVLSDEEKAANRQIAVCCSRSKTRQLVLDI
ncbi:MAG: ferredoxin [Sphingomonadales bacterium]|nr:ferredoxin [Sphingomonadales bacterium]